MMTIAFAFRDGRIEFGSKCPVDAIPIANSPNKRKLLKIISGNARHSHNGNSLLVPGIPEAADEDDAVLSLRYFSEIVAMRLSDETGWPPVSQELRDSRDRSLSGGLIR